MNHRIKTLSAAAGAILATVTLAGCGSTPAPAAQAEPAPRCATITVAAGDRVIDRDFAVVVFAIESAAPGSAIEVLVPDLDSAPRDRFPSADITVYPARAGSDSPPPILTAAGGGASAYGGHLATTNAAGRLVVQFTEGSDALYMRDFFEAHLSRSGPLSCAPETEDGGEE